LLLMLAVGTEAAFTVTVIGLDVMEAGLAQVNEEVIRTRTWALLVKVPVVNVGKI
jgi:hypothetical protein